MPLTIQANKNIVPVQCDVSSADELLRAAAEIKCQTSFVNCVIACAGALGDVKLQPTPWKPDCAGEVSQLLLNGHKNNTGVLEVNVAGTYTTFTAFLPLLLASNTDPNSLYHQRNIHSQFMVVSSISALHQHTQTGYIYNASKAALNHLAKCLSNDFAYLGVRVNTIAPGMFMTEMIEHYFPDPAATARPGGMPKEQVPAERTGTPEVSGMAVRRFLKVLTYCRIFLEQWFILPPELELSSMVHCSSLMAGNLPCRLSINSMYDTTSNKPQLQSTASDSHNTHVDYKSGVQCPSRPCHYGISESTA